MQGFSNEVGKRRLINLSNMKEDDAETFFVQYTHLPKELQKFCEKELKQQIRQIQAEDSISQWILAISTKDGKLIGKMEITSIDGVEASVRIQIPNENWILKYGVEALDQFYKICKEKSYFERIELDSGSISERYMKVHNLKSKTIEVA